MTDNNWIDESLRKLENGSDWTPDTTAAFARLQRRDRVRRAWRRSWIWTTAIVSVAGISLIIAPAPATCAVAGIGCANNVKTTASYKEEGSARAPITIEIFTDYECPHCALFYQNVYPSLAKEFVSTGRVRIVHRDLPLPQHPSARLAARYANAAGELGQYNLVVSTLFNTQQQWSPNGNVDGVVAQVLPPGTMQKVRACVQSDPALDRTLSGDSEIVAQNQINQTPTLLISANGERHKLAGAQSWEVLRAYLKELLK